MPGAQEAGQIDVAALFERLREEVRKGGALWASANGTSGGPVRLSARMDAERLWPVSADRPLAVRPGLQGRVAVPVKGALRKLMRWYVEPLAADQRAFNDAVLKLVDDLEERVQRALDARLLAEVEERLTRLERRERAVPATTTAAVPGTAAAPPLPDYFAYESRMRGSTAEIRERQRPYVESFRDAAPVLDLGCGRGEFLGLLREAGVEARGVDLDADMVAFARGEGLEVEGGDALAALALCPDGSLGGIFAAQLLEHLEPRVLVPLLELAAVKLRSGGLLVAETINPLSPLALRNYFADLTHAQPLVPETLALLTRQAGFSRAEIRFLNEPPASERLGAVELPREPAFDAARIVLAGNVARLNELLFGPLDYAVVARA